MAAEALKLSDSTPGFLIFTRTELPSWPLLMTEVESDTASTVPGTESTKSPTNTVAGWPT